MDNLLGEKLDFPSFLKIEPSYRIKIINDSILENEDYKDVENENHEDIENEKLKIETTGEIIYSGNINDKQNIK